MPVLTEFALEITPEEVLKALNKGQRPLERFLNEVTEAIALARQIWEPAVVYGWFSSEGVKGETLSLTWRENERKTLNIGPHAELAAPAEEVLVGVNTIGVKLDEKVRELNQSGDGLLGYFLDSVGVIALGKTRDEVCRIAESEALERDWRVSPALAPGSLTGWSIREQAEMVSMVPISDIRVRLSESGVLFPIKSASILIGIGPNYKTNRVGSVCHLCQNRDSCWRRRY
jgi:hypothetical protein